MARGFKSGGRKQGVPNKVNGELKEVLNNFLERRFEQMESCFDELPPKDKIRAFIDMLSFVLPKMQPAKKTMDSNILVDFTEI